MPRYSVCALPLVVLVATPAAGQRVRDNAAASAEDAFGTSIGNERVGLYSSTDVRGFSPVQANNIRLEGLYLDRPAAFTDRLVEGNSIRVGLTAQNYLFPAPTGIVDYRIRPAGNRPMVSTMMGVNSFGGGRIEVDAQIPVVADRLSIVAGAAGFLDALPSGANAVLASYAIAPRWRPREGLEIIPFWSRIDTWDREATPIYIPAGPYLPPRVERRLYPGPDWADQRNIVTHLGGIAKWRAGGGWALAAGLFRSVTETPEQYAHILADLTPDGTATRRISRDPLQKVAATSGEVRLSRTIEAGRSRHSLHATLRGRLRDSLFGGGRALSFGRVGVEDPIRVARPEIAVGAQTVEDVSQWIAGLAYDGRWSGIGTIGLGLQRTGYRKTVARPDAAPSRTVDHAWLPTATLALDLAPKLALYGSYTRGLEESGIAPDSAANRTEVLPAILTSQADAGLRWKATERLNVVAGLFEVSKPYFAADAQNVFTELGTVRHRGVELSVAGNVADRLTLVAGAVLMRPRVTGEPVREGRIGRRALGQTGRILTLATQYALPGVEGLQLTLNVTHRGARAADTLNRVEAPARTLIDAGVRYTFKLAGTPALLRFTLVNLTNAYDWQIVGSGGYQVNQPRNATLFLTMDF